MVDVSVGDSMWMAQSIDDGGILSHPMYGDLCQEARNI